LTKFCATKFRRCKKPVFWYATNAFFPYLSPDMFYLKKNKIHQKVQREKLYNFQRTVSFIYVPFGLKKSNFWVTNFRRYKNSARWRNLFFCISSFYPLIHYLKKSEYIKRCSVKSSTFYKRQLFYLCTYCCQKKHKVLRSTFRSVEIWSLTTLSLLNTKIVTIKLPVLCRL
jgi:hypothetical protein